MTIRVMKLISPALNLLCFRHSLSLKCQPLLSFLIILILSQSFVFAQNPECTATVQSERVEKNLFNVGRGFSEYAKKITRTGKSLFQIFASLPKDSIWFDMGAGLSHALTHGLLKFDQLKKGIAVVYKNPSEYQDPRTLHPKLKDRYENLEGDLIQDLYLKGKLDPYLGKVHVITDVYGPLTYTRFINEVLQIYLDLLAPGGKIYFIIREGSNPIYSSTKRNPSWMNFLKSIDGVEVLKLSPENNPEKESSFVIQKIKSKALVKKPLTEKLYEDGLSLRRVFWWN